MPASARPLPMFAAEPPQEPLPYGRWGEALAERFLEVAGKIETEEQLGDPGEMSWFPDRTWGGRTYVPGTAPTSEGFELFGYVSYTREHEGAQAADFKAAVDYTSETSEAEPRLDARPLRPRDRPLARVGRTARVAHTRMGRGAGERRRGGHRGAGTDYDDQCALVDDRFTLISLDDYTGDYVEVRLFGPRGAELARESLYEEE